MVVRKLWVVTIVFAVLILLTYDAHVENPGLRQVVMGWLGNSLIEMRWRECTDAKKAICN